MRRKLDSVDWAIIAMAAIMGVFLSVCLTFCTDAQAEEWTLADSTWQLAATSTLLIDYAQTEDLVHQGHNHDYHETNPILGAHPSAGAVRRYFAGAVVLDYLVARALPQGPLRRAFQMGTVGIELATIGHNKHIGIGVRF
jgi:hypothetical protein